MRGMLGLLLRGQSGSGLGTCLRLLLKLDSAFIILHVLTSRGHKLRLKVSVESFTHALLSCARWLKPRPCCLGVQLKGFCHK